MSDAFKCDRCDVYGDAVGETVKRHSGETVKRHGGYTKVELCDDCVEEFDQFMERELGGRNY